MNEILYKEEVFEIQGAVFDVYREMGCGFLEAVYQECMEKELRFRRIPFEAQKDLHLVYKGEKLNQTYRPDLVCYGKIIVELKAVKETVGEHRAQIFNYLKATGMRLGLLVNFGHYPKATVERIIFMNHEPHEIHEKKIFVCFAEGRIGWREGNYMFCGSRLYGPFRVFRVVRG